MQTIERVRNIIAGKLPDRLPVQPMTMIFSSRHAGIPFIDYTKDYRKMAEAQLSVFRDFELDCVITCSDPAREVIDIDGEGSVDWLHDQGPAINENRAVLADKSRFRTLRQPDPCGGGRMHDRVKGIALLRKELGPGDSVVGWIEGPLALAQELRGLNNIMVDFTDDPGFVGDLLDYAAEVAIRYAPVQIEAGADTIGMSDAAASMIGPELYAKLLWPRQKRVLEFIRTRHPQTILRLHMCGRTDPLLDRMRELPVDIFELDFPVDLKYARRVMGPEKVILGNVSTIADLFEGTPEQVYEACRRCHQIAGRYHIVGAGCEISALTPPENLRAMVQYARDHTP